MTNPNGANLASDRLPRAERLTPNDRLVLTTLEQQNRPMKAYDLLACLKDQGINAPMTVYRALGRLCDRGRVRKIESTNAYFAIPEPKKGEVGAFLLCQRCGAVGFEPLAEASIEGLVGGVEVYDASIELRTGCLGDRNALSMGACLEEKGGEELVN